MNDLNEKQKSILIDHLFERIRLSERTITKLASNVHQVNIIYDVKNEVDELLDKLSSALEKAK